MIYCWLITNSPTDLKPSLRIFIACKRLIIPLSQYSKYLSRGSRVPKIRGRLKKGICRHWFLSSLKGSVLRSSGWRRSITISRGCGFRIKAISMWLTLQFGMSLNIDDIFVVGLHYTGPILSWYVTILGNRTLKVRFFVFCAILVQKYFKIKTNLI